MAESIIETELQHQLARNEELIRTIVDHGADLDEERQIDFFFYAPDEPSATALAHDLEANDFDEVLVAQYDDEKWAVQAVRNDSVTAITDERFVRRVVTLAAQRLAEFDGWGTAV